MQPGPPRRRRARPVADAPLDALVGASEDLAKGWLLALLEQEPLERAHTVVAGDLARDGPRVCEAVVRALGSDVDLRRIESGGALEWLASQTGELVGAQSAEQVSRAVDALQAVIWSALRSELGDADADQVGALAERVSIASEALRAAALRRAEQPAGDQAEFPGKRGRAVPSLRVAGEEHVAREDDVVVHEGEAVPDGGEASPRASSDAPPHEPADPLWVGALEDEVIRARGSAAPLSLLIVELEEGERVLGSERPRQASATFGRFAQAIRGVMRRQDLLACETDARAWVIARDTGRNGAQALASRIAEAVRAAEPWRGVPLTVSVGTAVLGEDAQEAAGLISAAEEAKFAASASGIAVSRGLAGDQPEDG